MKISIIAALNKDNIIGYQGQIPWYLPEDLKRFKRLTVGKPIIMGHKTFESLGKPLPDRLNIVMSHDPTRVQSHAENVRIAISKNQALRLAGGAKEVMIIGGAEIYKLFLPLATHMYLTYVTIKVPGDTFFPQWKSSEWKMSGRELAHPSPDITTHYEFLNFERKSNFLKW